MQFIKRISIMLLILLAAFWGSINQGKVKTWWEGVEKSFDRFGGHDESADSDSGAEESPPEPAPGPVAVAIAPLPPPAPYAASATTLPEGTFYTRERITQVTDVGVRSISAGVKVTKVGEENGMLVVDDGKIRVLTAQSKLTNDVLEVAALKQAAAPGAPVKGSKASAGSSSPPSRTEPSARAAADAKRRGLQAQIGNIDRQMWMIRQEIGRLTDEAASARARGRPSTYNDRTIAALNSQLGALQAQRSDLEYKLAQLPR